ncbi:MAG: LacI family transcriptional regulator [Bifidobacteriaceae bacterium]|jgi:LacI family transcriptional regulator|nr:LacI family transcriptional regulator [Bifidobacteriaceae bacterium]
MLNVLPRQQGHKITIQEIADLAGVSVATVSNVINHKHSKVSQRTIDKINQLIKEYGFAPNLSARSLVTAKSGLLGILFYSPKQQIDFNDPFLSDVLTGIESASKAQGKFILVHGFSNVSDIQLIQQSWNFDGYVVIGAFEKIHNQINKLLQSPVVFIDTYLQEGTPVIDTKSVLPPRYYIYNNDRELSSTATELLIKNGHQKIAFFAPKIGMDEPGVVNERYAGYLDALNAYQIQVEPSWFFDENSERELIKRSQEYTAVLANSDYLAAKLNKAFREKEVTDKSLVGFDNSYLGSIITPRLTSVELEQKTKGQKAVEVLGVLDESKTSDQLLETIIVPGYLLERDSVFNLKSRQSGGKQ